MRLWWGVAASVALAAAGCGEAPAPAPALLRGEPAGYLLTVDQLVSPDFTLDVPAHTLAVAGSLTGAGEEFFRRAANLADANGPVQVRDTVEEFAATADAATAFRADVLTLNGTEGATPISTGALGNEAHATAVIVATSGGTRVVEFTVEWRVENLIDILVVRGRDGGTRLDDALLLAHRQTVTELGLSTPDTSPRASASPSPG